VLPVLATDALVSLPSVPMSVVQSVIPISATLIVVAELLHLFDLVRLREPPVAAGSKLAEALQ
jgi:TRAP-type C4-dicarboxylate transport system permease small subunit